MSDATAASTLWNIDGIIVLIIDPTRIFRQCITYLTSQIKDLTAYFHRAYYQEVKQWAGAGEIVI